MAAANGVNPILIPTGPPNVLNPAGTGPYKEIKPQAPVQQPMQTPQPGMPMQQPIAGPTMNRLPTAAPAKPAAIAGKPIGKSPEAPPPHPAARPLGDKSSTRSSISGNKQASSELKEAGVSAGAASRQKTAAGLGNALPIANSQAQTPATAAQMALQRFMQGRGPIARPTPPANTPTGGPIGRLGMTGQVSKRLA